MLSVDWVDEAAVDENVQDRVEGSGPVKEKAGDQNDDQVDQDIELAVVHTSFLPDHDA